MKKVRISQFITYKNKADMFYFYVGDGIGNSVGFTIFSIAIFNQFGPISYPFFLYTIYLIFSRNVITINMNELLISKHKQIFGIKIYSYFSTPFNIETSYFECYNFLDYDVSEIRKNDIKLDFICDSKNYKLMYFSGEHSKNAIFDIIECEVKMKLVNKREKK